MELIMNNIGLVFLIVIMFLSWILAKVTGVNDSKLITDGNSKSYVLRYPSSLIGISIILMIAGIAVIIYMNQSIGELSKPVMYVIDGIIVVVYAWLLSFIFLKVYRYRVVVDVKNGITVYQSIGAAYTFKVSDIVSVKHHLNSILMRTDNYVIEINTGKKFKIVSTMVSYDQFLKLLHDECGSLVR